MKRTVNLLVAVACTLALQSAYALGGLDKANDTANEIKTGFYIFVGTCSGIYLLWLALMAKLERKQWADFGMGVVHVAIAGGVSALAGWAWTLFA